MTEIRRQLASLAAASPASAACDARLQRSLGASAPDAADGLLAAAHARASAAEAAAEAAASERDALRAALSDAERELAASDAAAAPLRTRIAEQDTVLLELLGATPAKAASSPIGAAWTRRVLHERAAAAGSHGCAERGAPVDVSP
jgi:hypothetical protein